MLRQTWCCIVFTATACLIPPLVTIAQETSSTSDAAVLRRLDKLEADSAIGRAEISRLSKEVVRLQKELDDAHRYIGTVKDEGAKALKETEKALSGQQNKIEFREYESVPVKEGPTQEVVFSRPVKKVFVSVSGYQLYGHFWRRGPDDAGMRIENMKVKGKEVHFAVQTSGQGGHSNSRVKYCFVAWLE